MMSGFCSAPPARSQAGAVASVARKVPDDAGRGCRAAQSEAEGGWGGYGCGERRAEQRGGEVTCCRRRRSRPAGADREGVRVSDLCSASEVWAPTAGGIRGMIAGGGGGLTMARPSGGGGLWMARRGRGGAGGGW